MEQLNQIDEEIPSELSDLMLQLREAKQAKIDAIGREVAKNRDEAVKGRKASGVETIWEEDEEYYQGVDDANRDQVPWLKSPSSAGGLSRRQVSSATRCTSFFNITRQFCESASARMGDILLPAGDWNFAIKPTPVPDKQTTSAAPGLTPAPIGQAQDAQQMPQPGAQPPLSQMPPAPMEQSPPSVTTGEQPGAALPPVNSAQDACDKAELQLRDWLVECSYHSEVRKVLEDAAILGTGILKGPVPKKRISRKVVTLNNAVALEMVETLSPVSKHVELQDFFPDPTCGDNIHDGNYVLERDRLSAKQLKELKGTPGYMDDQIDKVLEEGPSKKNYIDGLRSTDDKTLDSDKYEVWYYYGQVDTAGLSAMNVKVNETDAKKKMLPAVVTLVNDTPIRAFINPLDSGEFPYDVMVWQRASGSWAGIGVARQMRTAQAMLNASARAMMDNAGLSSGPMLIIRQNAIVPADGKWEVTARKVWLATEQADVRSVGDAIMAINIPMMQAELSAIIQLAKSMAEEATGIFFLMQGQQGSAPDTVGGMQLLHQNASTILRRLARVFDERITEPHIRRYYEYLLVYGDDDACKGDMQIEAIGSTALVEREIQAMQSMQLLNMSVNPAFGLDPAKAVIEVLKSMRFAPDKWTLDDDQKQAQSQQPPMIPAIEVEKIRSADRQKQMQLDAIKADKTASLSTEKNRNDLDRDALYADTMARRDQTTREIRIEEMRLKREMAILDYTNRHNISLEQVKAKLASDAMKLRVQKQLARTSSFAKQVATPATEPPQHAADGRAFQE